MIFIIINTELLSQNDSSLKINKLSKYKIGRCIEIKDDSTIKNGTKRNFIIENQVDSFQNGVKISYLYNTYQNRIDIFNYKIIKNLKNKDYFDTIISPLTLKSFEDTIPNIRITYDTKYNNIKHYDFIINIPISTIIINCKKLYKCKSYVFSGANYQRVLEIVNNEYKNRNNYIWDHSYISYYDSSFEIPIITHYHMSNPREVFITKFYQLENNIKYELSENDFIFYLQNLNCILGW